MTTQYTSELGPYLAPLSLTMIEYLAKQDAERLLITTSLEDQLNTLKKRIITRVYTFLPQVYAALVPAIRANRLSSEWVSEQMTTITPNKTEAFSLQTLSRWRKEGLLRYSQKDRPNIDNVAALLLLRLLNTQRKGWYPSSIKKDEPLWYCFRQDSPTSPIVPCSTNPLPSDLPKNALLFTPYQLARFQPDWLAFGDYGCIRWAGTTVEDGRLLWDLTEEDMSVWDNTIISSHHSILEKAHTPLVHHTMATMILLTLATEKFAKQGVLLPL